MQQGALTLDRKHRSGCGVAGRAFLGSLMVEDFAVRIPLWVVLPVIILIVLGAWKLVKLLLLTRG